LLNLINVPSVDNTMIYSIHSRLRTPSTLYVTYRVYRTAIVI